MRHRPLDRCDADHGAVLAGDGAHLAGERLEGVLEGYRIVVETADPPPSAGVRQDAMGVGRERVIQIRADIEEPADASSTIRLTQPRWQAQGDNLGDDLEIVVDRGELRTGISFSHGRPSL